MKRGMPALWTEGLGPPTFPPSQFWRQMPEVKVPAKVPAGGFLLRPEEETVPSSPLPALWCWPVIFGVPRLVTETLQAFLSTFIFTEVLLVSEFPLFIGTAVILDYSPSYQQ